MSQCLPGKWPLVLCTFSAGCLQSSRRICICSVIQSLMQYTATIQRVTSPPCQSIGKKRRTSTSCQIQIHDRVYTICVFLITPQPTFLVMQAYNLEIMCNLNICKSCYSHFFPHRSHILVKKRQHICCPKNPHIWSVQDNSLVNCALWKIQIAAFICGINLFFCYFHGWRGCETLSAQFRYFERYNMKCSGPTHQQILKTVVPDSAFCQASLGNYSRMDGRRPFR